MTREPERPEPASRQRAGRIGRRVALGIYWVFMLYVAVVSFYSLVPQTFWPTTPVVLDETAVCDTELRALVERLREHAGATMGGEPTNDDFFRRWDDRYVALAPRCDGDARYDRVGTLRHRIHTTTRRFAREDGHLFEEVERSLRTPREGS